MRIAIMGAGSVGGYLGGMLARGGHDVSLIARGTHLAAIRERGLQVIRDSEEFTVSCVATDDPGEVGPVELALLTVKTYQNADAVPAMMPLAGPGTTVLCLQNGIDSYLTPAEAFGEGRVLPGAVYIETGTDGPGVVRQAGDVVRVVFGEPDGSLSDRGRAVADALNGSGIPAEFTADIRTGLWSKFLFIATMAGVTAMARQTLAELMPRSEWREVVVGCLQEIEAAGRASGVNFPPDIHETTLAYIEDNLADLQASMHTDVMAGRPLELEALNGAVVRAGRVAGVLTPINDVVYAMLRPLAGGVS
jgi:2-dehydropantoate 2-reductase